MLVTRPSGWPAGGIKGAVDLKLTGEASGRSAYDVEGYQLCVIRVNEDSYVLGPAGRCEHDAGGYEVVNAGACSAPQ